MSEFRVLTTKEQAKITGLLNTANEALVAANAIVAGEVAAKPRKAHKPRAPKAAAPKAAPAEAAAPKRRGRPPSKPQEAPIEI